jgi:hypothetical protein
MPISPEREPRVAAEGEPRSTPATTSAPASALAGRSAEPRRFPPVPVQPVSESDEQNLAEMAQQLESALQRQRPAAAPAIVSPAPRADSPSAPARSEVKLEIKPETKPETKPEAKPETKPLAKVAARPTFDNLEQEMASLLGRPSGKS